MLFSVVDVPVLVMSPCRRGATSPASQIVENLSNVHPHDRFSGEAFPSSVISESLWRHLLSHVFVRSLDLAELLVEFPRGASCKIFSVIGPSYPGWDLFRALCPSV